LATRNHFLSVNLTVGDSEKQRAMQSKKGERVTLVCEEMHRIIFPTGTGCRFK